MLKALYPLSYRRMGRRTGFEPVTSRFANEVSAIFTTDRGGGWRGTRDAVAAVVGRPPLVMCGNRTRAVRSNRHLHHRRADPSRIGGEGRWGTGDIGVSDTFSDTSFAGRSGAVARGGACEGDLHGA